MGPTRTTRVRHRSWRRFGVLATTALVLLGTAGCSADTAFGRLGMPSPVTQEGEDIVLPFWQNAWILAWIVGGFTWGLMLWVTLRYRRKAGDPLPGQLRYNMPLEALYTFTPVVIVLALFFFTARDTSELTKLTDTTQHTVGVVGQKWSWTFNYVQEDAYDTGTPEVPSTLWLPVGEKTRFTLTSPDVIHDFWVPAFLFKMDIIPGRENQFELTPNKVGHVRGPVCRAVRRRPLADALHRQGRAEG